MRKKRTRRAQARPKPAAPAATPLHWLLKFEQEREALEDARAERDQVQPGEQRS